MKIYHRITWHTMVLHGIPWYYMAYLGITWHTMVLLLLLLPFKLRTLCLPHINVARVFSSRDHYCVGAGDVMPVRVRFSQNMSRLFQYVVYCHY